jgi:lipoate-protein ligase A
VCLRTGREGTNGSSRSDSQVNSQLLQNLLCVTDLGIPLLDGYTNMALDVGLLEHAERGRSGWRVYGWDGPWVSLGKQQAASFALLDPDLVPWVVRPTGGLAVLHGHDVTVGLALPLSLISPSEDLSRSVRRVYRFLAAPLVSALQECGLDVCLGEDSGFVGRGVKSADCFAKVSPNDIVYRASGVKACGCALRLTSSAVLLQASIPNGHPLVDPSLVFADPHIPKGEKWDASGISSALNRTIETFIS